MIPKRYLVLGILVLLLIGTASAANLLINTSEFNRTAWSKTYISVYNDTGTAPDGTTSADTLRESPGVSSKLMYQQIAVTTGTNYTSSFDVKLNASSPITIVQLTHSGTLFGTNQYANFNLTSGLVQDYYNGTATMTSNGSGWYRCSWTSTATSSGTGAVAILALTDNNVSLGRAPTYNTTTIRYVDVWGASTEEGDSPPSPPAGGDAMVDRNIPAGYQFFPADSIWYTPVNNLSVHAQSANYIAGIKTVEAYALPGYPATRNNVSLFVFDGAEYFVVNSSTPKQYLMNRNMSTGTAYSSSYYRTRDTELSAQIPIPTNMTWMVGGSDAAVNLVDNETKIIYQLGVVSVNGTGYNAYPAIWNMSSYLYRFSAYANGTDNGNRWLGNTYTQRIDPNTISRYEKTPTFYVSMASAPTIQSLIRHEEVQAGYINHSIGVTLYAVNGTATWPALGSGHWGETSWMGWTNNTPPAGAYARLKSTYNVEGSGMGTYAKVVARAAQTYGVWVTDNGCYYSMCFLGANNTAWNTSEKADLNTLKRLTIDDFEWVDTSSLMIDRYSMKANVSSTTTGVAPVAQFYMNLTSAISSLLGAGGYSMGTMYAGNPIGGGAGYSSIYTESGVTALGATGHVITDTADFVAHMDGGASEAASGDVVFLPNSLTVNLSSYDTITIPGGVTIASDRGYAGSSGATITKTGYTNYDWVGRMLAVGGNNVRITGLTIRGEMLPSSSTPLISESNYLTGIYNYGNTGLVIDNNELVGWSWAAVYVRNVPTVGRPVIKYNYVHDNIARSEGYGVEIAGGDLLFEGNYCNANRHTVTGAGLSGEKYEVRYNIWGSDGAPIGGYHVDVHETGDGTGDAYSYSGSTYHIHHNTVNNNATPLSGYQMPFVHITCDPQVGAYIYDNEILTNWGGTWGSASSGLSVSNYDGVVGVITQTKYRASVQQNVTAYDNRWRGVDYASNTGIVWYQGGT